MGQGWIASILPGPVARVSPRARHPESHRAMRRAPTSRDPLICSRHTRHPWRQNPKTGARASAAPRPR